MQSEEKEKETSQFVKSQKPLSEMVLDIIKTEEEI